MKTALQATLNPKLWEARDRLKPEVRGALLRIAQDFYDYVDIEFPILDIVITGSNVNYNYTNDSDLDLHLITDYDKLDCRDEADELFDTKRHLYEREHNIKIYGIPVSLYVEDQASPGVSQGLYSVRSNQWLIKPKQMWTARIDRAEIKDHDQMWHTIVNHVLQRRDLELANSTRKLITNYRRLGLKQPQAEFSTANMVYKNLRNDGTLDQLNDLIRDLHDQHLSVK